jgi:tetratricopeptide (TPR) repeat protein
LRLAEAESAAGHPAEAERQLRSAAERFRSVRALLALASLRSAARDAAGAHRALEQAREIAPDSEDVLSALAQSWLAQRRPERALPSLEALVRMYPSVAEHHYWRGAALLLFGDAKGAEEELREADRLQPKRALTLIALGEALNRLKRFGEAVASLQQGLALAPENVEALAALARAEEGEGRSEEAELHARRVLARDAGHGVANLVLGALLMKQGKYAEAREALERAVARDPSAKAHYQLSLAYTRLGDEVRARAQRELYEKAAKEEEERMNALGRLGGMGGRGMVE